MKETPTPEVVAKQPEDGASGAKENENTASIDSGTMSVNAVTKKRSLEESRSTCTDHDEPGPKKRKAHAQAATADVTSTQSGVRLKDVSDAAQEASASSGTGNQPLNIQCDQSEMMNYKSSDRPHRGIPRSLPPILIQTRSPNKLPAALRRFDPDTRIDIFNRKTGKIMSGDDAIRIHDLPQALLLHAEYEPIVPPSSNQPHAPREGRSAPNVRVDHSVAPQARRATAKYKGRKVKITKGPYRNYIGEWISNRRPSCCPLCRLTTTNMDVPSRLQAK